MGVATRTDTSIASPSGYLARDRERSNLVRGPGLPGSNGRANGTPSFPQPQIVGVAAGATAGGVHGVAGGWFSGAEQLTSDTGVALLLLRDARNRACARLFGVSEQDAGLVTIIALATLAHAANRKAHEVLNAIGPIHRSDAWLGEGVLNEGFYRIAGDASRDVQFIGSLILASVLLHSLRPVLGLSVHDLRVAAHRLRLDFDHRYGHLIRPNPSPSTADQG